MSMPPPHGGGLPAMPGGMMPGMMPPGAPMGPPMGGFPRGPPPPGGMMPPEAFFGAPSMGGDPFAMGVPFPGAPSMGAPPLKHHDAERGMKDAAEMLHNAALVMKRRRCIVAVDEVPGFVRTVYTLLRVCDPEIIGWSDDGTQIVIKESERFAAEICPKFFRHRNFNSFTRLLNMYQFHKVPSVQRDSKDVCFEHPHFQRGRDDLLPLVQRKGAQTMRDEMMARELWERGAMGLAPPGHPAALEASLTPIHGMRPGGPAEAIETHPGHWMRRMADLENEVAGLKAENDRLKALEAERETLKSQVATQESLIAVLQAASAPLAPFPAAAEPMPALPPGMPEPPEELREAFQSMGGPMMMMMSMMTGAMQQGLATGAIDAPPPPPPPPPPPADDAPPAKKARTDAD